MSTVKVPQGATGKVVTLPAPGRQRRKHVSAGKYDKALNWFIALRRYQAIGYTFEQALEQADHDFNEPAPPGRAQQKGHLK